MNLLEESGDKMSANTILRYSYGLMNCYLPEVLKVREIPLSNCIVIEGPYTTTAEIFKSIPLDYRIHVIFSHDDKEAIEITHIWNGVYWSDIQLLYSKQAIFLGFVENAFEVTFVAGPFIDDRFKEYGVAVEKPTKIYPLLAYQFYNGLALRLVDRVIKGQWESDIEED